MAGHFTQEEPPGSLQDPKGQHVLVTRELCVSAGQGVQKVLPGREATVSSAQRVQFIRPL